MRLIFLILFFISSLFIQAQVSFNIDSVAVWRDVYLEMNGYNNTYNEVWGFKVKGREYGVIGSRGGTYIVDITVARKPFLIKYIPGKYNDATNRDYHDYNGYLYMVCDQGPSTLQIADLHYLPDSIHIIYDSDELFQNCHNIFIDSNTAHLYACRVTPSPLDSSKFVDHLRIYDLSDSPIPELLLVYNGVDEFHDIWVKNDTAIGNNMNSGLFFYDFTDMKNPVILNSIQNYEDKGLNHAGYCTTDGRYYYFSDETHGMDLKVVDLDNYVDPQVVALFNAGVNKSEIVAHNVLVRDSFLFISYYHEGLQVYDIRKPAKPVKIGHYETYTKMVQPDPKKPPYKDYSGYKGAWGVYPFLPSGYILVSDREKGLFILDMSDLDGSFHPDLLDQKRIYPNPAAGQVDLVYPSNQVVKIQVIDLNGKVVEKSARFENYKSFTRIYLSQSLQQGIYILKVEGLSETFTEKLMKQ